MSKGGGRNVTRTQSTQQVRPGPGFDRISEALYGSLAAVNSDFNRAREGMFDAARGGGGINQRYSALFGAADPTANLALLNRTAQGDFLNANPYLDAVVGQTVRNMGEGFRDYVVPGVHAQASGVGRFGSSAHADLWRDAQSRFHRDVGDRVANIRYGDFSQERQNQIAAQQLLANYGQGILGDMANWQLGAYRAAGNPYAEMAGLLLPHIGRDVREMGTQTTPRPRQSALGTLGRLGMSLASIPLTGGASAPTLAGAAFGRLFGGPAG